MKIQIPLRFADFDRFGHVNNARMVALCEDHRMVMFTQLDEALGEGWAEGGFVVARQEVDYLKPITPDVHEVDVLGEVISVGRSSLRLRYVVSAGGVSAAELVVVVVRTNGHGSVPITDAARAWLEAPSVSTSAA